MKPPIIHERQLKLLIILPFSTDCFIMGCNVFLSSSIPKIKQVKLCFEKKKVNSQSKTHKIVTDMTAP